mgnify:CR=1 FL=1|jgi:hypothetical protein
MKKTIKSRGSSAAKIKLKLESDYYSDYSSTYTDIYELELPLLDSDDTIYSDDDLPLPPPQIPTIPEDDSMNFPGTEEEAEC